MEKTNKFALCINVEGAKEKKGFVLATGSLNALQNFTSFCNAPNHLLNVIKKINENKNNFINDSNNVKGLYIKNFKDIDDDGISISSNRGKKVKIIYKNDLDVLLCNSNDIKSIIKNNFSLSIDEIVNNDINKDKKEVLKELARLCSQFSRKFQDKMNKNFLNLDYNYDKRYLKVNTLWKNIGIFEDNLNEVIDYICFDPVKKQRFAYFLKDKIAAKSLFENYFVLGKKGEGGQRVYDLRSSNLNKNLKKNGEDNQSILEQVKENIKLLNDLNMAEPSNFIDIKYDEKIELENEVAYLKIMYESAKTKEEKERINFKINNLEGTLCELDNNEITYSDADYYIRKDEREY